MMRMVLYPALLLFALASQLNAQVQSLLHQNRERQYIVHLPAGYDGESTLPVVFVLHGGGGSAQVTQNFTQMNPVADAEGFLAVYPQGFTENSSGFVWADGRGTAADAQGIDDVGFIGKLIDSLGVQYNIDSTRLYACGFSNGGFMTQRLACELDGRFAAIGSLGCSMDVQLFADCAPEAPLPMLFVAGTADPFVPCEGGFMNINVEPIVPVDTAVQFWVRHNDCQTAEPVADLPNIVVEDNSTAQQLDFTDCECGAEVRFFRLIGAGHTWAGVENPAIEPLLGETNEDIEASEELWRFFHRFRQGCMPTGTSEAASEGLPVKLFPNPFRARLTIDFGAPLKARATVSLHDARGRRIRSIQLQRGNAQAVIPISDGLPPGTYWVCTVVGKKVQWERVVRH